MVPGHRLYKLRSQWASRLFVVASFTVRQLSASVSALLLSLVVVRLAGAEAWGHFVEPLVFLALAVQVVQWGSREYLMRAFSADPANLKRIWQQNTTTRAVLLPVVAVALSLYLGLNISDALVLALWFVAASLAQAMDVLVQYTRRYGVAITGEALQFTVIIAGIFGHPEGTSFSMMLLWWASGTALKAGYMLLAFRQLVFPGLRWQFEPSQLRSAMPFFLLGLLAMLHSRVNLYVFSGLETGEILARYQVLIGVLLLVQAIPAFILGPYVRNIYRLSGGAMQKLHSGIAIWGTLLCAALVVLVFPALYLLYGFSYAPVDWLLSFLLALPAYLTITLNYALYRRHQERKLLPVYLVSIGVNFGLNLLLIPEYGITGSLAAGVIPHWIVVLWLLQLQRRAGAP